jgi:hypothetical protein
MDFKDRGHMKTWTETVQKDEQGDLFIQLAPELLAEVGWNPGDTLQWVDRGDGTWELRKKSPPLESADS